VFDHFYLPFVSVPNTTGMVHLKVIVHTKLFGELLFAARYY